MPLLKRKMVSAITLTTLLASVLTLAFAVVETTLAPVVLVSPDSVTVRNGDIFNVSVVIENLAEDHGMVGAEFQVTWNSTMLKALNMYEVLFHEITPQSEWDNIWQIRLTFNNTKGIADYACSWMDIHGAIDDGYCPINGISGNHTLAIITMEAVETGSTTVNLPYVQVADVNATPLIGYGNAVDMDSSGNIVPRNPAPTPPISTNGNVTGVLSNLTSDSVSPIMMPEFGDMPLIVLVAFATISSVFIVIQARRRRRAFSGTSSET